MLADTLITLNAVDWPMQSSCCCRGFNNTVYIKSYGILMHVNSGVNF